MLGPFLQADIAKDRIDREEASGLITSLWQLMEGYSNQYNNRVIIGGRGRKHEEAADLFGELAIDATAELQMNQPQLSLRFYEGQNPLLWNKAIDAIANGCTFPMLYNDDVNIPAVARAFSVDYAMAENYTPFGCGEYVLGHYSHGSPNGVINLLKALEVTLHSGVDPATGVTVINDIPGPEEFNSFDDVLTNYHRVVEYNIQALAVQQKIEYQVCASIAPFGFISALSSDCIKRGRSAFNGGIRYLGGTIETYGNTNTADSLGVIEELVYLQKRIRLAELVTLLENNFQGREDIHRECLGIAKYGNDNRRADSYAERIHTHVCTVAAAQAKKAGLDYYLVVIINNWANTIFGRNTGASAEGRLAGESLANGNNPAPGADKNGVTAFLNSLVKLDPSIHAGAVQNMKFSKQWFAGGKTKFNSLLKTYFARGGSQAMITVLSRGDLEAAMAEPGKWGHVMVRVGGFSIRFIDLPRDAQKEVLMRTLN